MKNTLLLAIGVSIGIFLSGLTVPVSAADKETRQMMADIRMLQEQTQQLQNLIGALGKAMSEALDASLKSVNARLDAKLEEQNTSSVRSFANQKVSIDAITRDVGILGEKMAENNVRVGSLTQEVDALRKLVTQLTAAPRAAYDPVLGLPDGATAPPDTATVGTSPGAAFAQAYSEYYAGRYEYSIQGFEAYLKNFSDSLQADDAQVKICDAYIQLGDYAKAVGACDLAIKNYPSSDKLAEAYYRKAMGLKGLKRVDEARVAFQYVVKTFPSSQEAGLATTQLMSLPSPATRKP
jgi:TolA-binding protein